jgi:hypothetical protein
MPVAGWLELSHTKTKSIEGEIQMSAAGAAPSMTKRDLEVALVEKCWKDPEFKKQILADPKGMLERHIGTEVLLVLSVAFSAAVSFVGAVGSVAGTAALTKNNGW